MANKIKSVSAINLSLPLRRVRLFCYKPEIYSHLDIYNGNHFGADGKGITASLYTSKSFSDAKRAERQERLRFERQPQDGP